MGQVNLDAFGYNESVDVSTGTKTLAAADQGIVQNVTVSSVISLPTAAAGSSYMVRVAKPGLTVSVLPTGTDTMSGLGFTAAAVKGAVFTNLPAGSFIQLNGASGTYNVVRASGQGGTITRTP